MSEQTVSEEEKKDAFYEAMDVEMVKVPITLYAPFEKFIKEYLAFFGSKKTVADFCRQAIYDKVGLLYQEVAGYAGETHRFVDRQEWYEKWPYLSCVISYPEDEE